MACCWRALPARLIKRCAVANVTRINMNAASKHPIRVLMTTSVFPRWPGDGTPPFVLRQAEALAALGCEVTVLAPHCAGAARHERLGSVEVVRFRYLWPASWQGLCYDGGMLVQLRKHPLRKWQLPFFLLAQIQATKKLCNAKSFDLVHAHSLLPQGYTALFNGQLPVVATSHGNDVFGLSEGGLYGRLKRQVIERVAAITANSSATEAALKALGAPEGRIHRVPSNPNVTPADPDQAKALRAKYGGERVIVFAGRLLEEKGVGDLIAAFAQLKLDARLVLLGEGVDRSKFEAQARALGVAERVTFAGWVDAPTLANHLAMADLFAGPSKPGPGGWVEAQGLVFVEAMAAGAPIVATRCGGIPDMVIDGETGLLVTPGDVEALSSTIQQALSDAALRKRLSENARRRYEEHFSTEQVTKRLLHTYESVLEKEKANSELNEESR